MINLGVTKSIHEFKKKHSGCKQQALPFSTVRQLTHPENQLFIPKISNLYYKRFFLGVNVSQNHLISFEHIITASDALLCTPGPVFLILQTHRIGHPES